MSTCPNTPRLIDTQYDMSLIRDLIKCGISVYVRPPPPVYTVTSVAVLACVQYCSRCGVRCIRVYYVRCVQPCTCTTLCVWGQCGVC